MNFIDLPIPMRRERLVIVAQWARVEALVCEAPYCKQTAEEEMEAEFADCLVCGRQLCSKCFNEAKGVNVTHGAHTHCCCQDCANLSEEERDAILALRVKLDQF